MIAGVRGPIFEKLSDALLVDCGGVIYRVGTSSRTLSEVGERGDDVVLRTHLVVREDQLTLYGFSSQSELTMFEALISVTGIGPKLACAILSHLPPDALPVAIAQGNADLLATVPGVGKKTAARLIVELRGKMPEVESGGMVTGGSFDDEVVAALKSLGYTTAEAHTAVIRTGKQDGASIEERVIAALRELAG